MTTTTYLPKTATVEAIQYLSDGSNLDGVIAFLRGEADHVEAIETGTGTGIGFRTEHYSGFVMPGDVLHLNAHGRIVMSDAESFFRHHQPTAAPAPTLAEGEDGEVGHFDVRFTFAREDGNHYFISEVSALGGTAVLPKSALEYIQTVMWDDPNYFLEDIDHALSRVKTVN